MHKAHFFVFVSHQISPLFIIGFFFLAYATLALAVVAFWLYKKVETNSAEILKLRNPEPTAVS